MNKYRNIIVLQSVLFITLLLIGLVECYNREYVITDDGSWGLENLQASSQSSESSEEQQNNNKDEVSSIWAVLIAGSSGYDNYRHQADVCHAYQILHRHGVPDTNIIVMMVDDVAMDPQNPTPGIIINRPNGSDVYAGVPKDYTGTNVTPEVFLKVLLGDKDGLEGVGSGKVLESGPNDHVFINFVDHGAPGLVAFPESELHAKDLEATLLRMHSMNKYKKLVFYLEACESGSMFDRILPAHLNIFATTAANDEESSYAIYFDDKRETYLGDVYSVRWMENSDAADLETETLQNQFLLVKKETNTSHVMEFGDKSLRSLPVGQFLGDSSQAERIVYEPVPFDAIETVDVPRVILEKKLEKTVEVDARRVIKQKLARLHKLRKFVNTKMIELIDEVVAGDETERTKLLKSHAKLNNFDCYEKVVKYFSKNCFSIAKNSYVTRKLYVFVNMCEFGWRSEVIIEAMANKCIHTTTYTGIQ